MISACRSHANRKVALKCVSKNLLPRPNYFKHAVTKHTFGYLRQFTWWRIVQMMRARHRWKLKDFRRWLTDPQGWWRPITAPSTFPRSCRRHPGR
jgi:hypothetical protein